MGANDTPALAEPARTTLQWQLDANAVARVRMNRQWGGIVDTTPDACPIISKTPVPNMFFNCGWGTGGFKATPGSGNVFAASLAKGEMHPLAAPFSIDRFHNGALIDEHGAAAVAH